MEIIQFNCQVGGLEIDIGIIDIIGLGYITTLHLLLAKTLIELTRLN